MVDLVRVMGDMLVVVVVLLVVAMGVVMMPVLVVPMEGVVPPSMGVEGGMVVAQGVVVDTILIQGRSHWMTNIRIIIYKFTEKCEPVSVCSIEFQVC